MDIAEREGAMRPRLERDARGEDGGEEELEATERSGDELDKGARSSVKVGRRAPADLGRPALLDVRLALDAIPADDLRGAKSAPPTV